MRGGLQTGNRIKAGLIVLALALAIFACNEKRSYPESPQAGDGVSIALSALGEAEPLFLSYHHEGKRIDFFVLKIGGGVQSYLDACAKCAPKKLGYHPDGGDMVCRACGMRYPLDALKGIGSCYPIPLEGKVEGDNYIIEKENIIKGKRYF
jgi:uncharacterized membrane protein